MISRTALGSDASSRPMYFTAQRAIKRRTEGLRSRLQSKRPIYPPPGRGFSDGCSPALGGLVTDARYTYTAGMPAARVGWLVARARSVAGVGERDLASSVGVPVRVVRRWERGE